MYNYIDSAHSVRDNTVVLNMAAKAYTMPLYAKLGRSFSSLPPELCPSGEYWDTGSDRCQPCDRGFYKDNSLGVDAKLGQCQLCPQHLITEDIGSVSQQNCTQGEIKVTHV